MTIQRTEPMAMHKRLPILCIEAHPEQLRDYFPNWDGTAEECLKWLKEAKEEWFYGGEFITDAELNARHKKAVKSCPPSPPRQPRSRGTKETCST